MTRLRKCAPRWSSVALAAWLAALPFAGARAAAPPAAESLAVEQARAAARRLEAELAQARERLAAAIKANTPPPTAEDLWREANRHLRAKRDAQAVGTLERYLEKEKRPARLAEAYYRLAEAHRRLGNVERAAVACKYCIKYPTRFAFLARYELAQVELAAGNLEAAESALQLNLSQLKFEPDEEAQEKTLFALGGLLYQRRNFRAAVRPLAEALNRFKDNPEAIKARFQLADSYRQIGSEVTQKFLLGAYKTPEAQERYQQEHRRWLRKAAEELDTLTRLLDTPRGKGQLTAEQRTTVPFITAKCWFYLGEYRKALAINERLIERHRGTVEELDALAGAIQCHTALNERDQIRPHVLRIRAALPRHGEAVRRAWEQWLNDIVRADPRLLGAR